MEHKKDAATLASFDYQVSRNGKRLAVSELIGNSTAELDYSYDPQGRLTEAVRTTFSGPSTTTYTYDEVGNRCTEDDAGTVTTYTYNALDQLETETKNGTPYSYEYDGNGNLKQKSWGTEEINYVYDCRNRLRSVYNGEILESNLQAEYDYDHFGNRVGKAGRSYGNGFDITRQLVDNNNLTGYSPFFSYSLVA